MPGTSVNQDALRDILREESSTILRVGRSRAARGKRGNRRRQPKRKGPGLIFFIALIIMGTSKNFSF
jgi:hypothetical protein